METCPWLTLTLTRSHGAQRHEEPKQATEEYEVGTYVYFDFNIVHDGTQSGWCYRLKQARPFCWILYCRNFDLHSMTWVHTPVSHLIIVLSVRQLRRLDSMAYVRHDDVWLCHCPKPLNWGSCCLAGLYVQVRCPGGLRDLSIAA